MQLQRIGLELDVSKIPDRGFVRTHPGVCSDFPVLLHELLKQRREAENHHVPSVVIAFEFSLKFRLCRLSRRQGRRWWKDLQHPLATWQGVGKVGRWFAERLDQRSKVGGSLSLMRGRGSVLKRKVTVRI